MADEAVKDMHSQLMDAITEIDIKLDSLDDTGGATKRKLSNELVDANQSVWEPVVTNLISQLGNLDADTLVGVYKGIEQGLRSAFSKSVDDHLEQRVESEPKAEPLITPDEVSELSSQRSELYKNIKQVVNLAEVMYGLELEMPKIRRGSKGKRGPRAVTLMTWAINGEELDADIKYKEVAELAGFEKASELTAYLKDKGVNTREPENGEINVDLPDGRTLYGYIPEDDDDSDDEDSDD